ncbi:MAG: hypothetical protein H6737_31905 [Alphaproteobacteria bacterium]|nr:hypothetical protein [Alphaproteobacteria bacterium]
MRIELAFRCTERLQDMPETGCGWHCAKCDKPVVDLDRLGPIAKRVAVWAPDEPPCVKVTARPGPATRLARLAGLGAALVAGTPATATEPVETHVCSPESGGGVVMLGGIGGRSRFSLLRAIVPWQVREWVSTRLSRPHGDGVAHLSTAGDWEKVTVRCDEGRLPRRVHLENGEALVKDLPDYDACTFTLRGDAPTQRVEFVVSRTSSEAGEDAPE